MECIISISQTFLLDVKRLRKKYKSTKVSQVKIHKRDLT